MFRCLFVIAVWLSLGFQVMAALTGEELAEALDTPGWEWSTAEGGNGPVSRTVNVTANGGLSVTFPVAAEIAVTLAGDGMIRIRYRNSIPRASWNGEQLTVTNVAYDPENAGTDWSTAVLMAPAGGGMLKIFGSWYTEIDSVVRLEPPASLGALLDLDQVTTGGAATWGVRAVPSLGRYVAGITVKEDAKEGWLEFPVEGPAEVAVGYIGLSSWSAIEFLVDGRRVWDSGAGYGNERTVKIEIPAGSHSLRIAGRMAADHEMELMISDIEVGFLPEGGKIGAALDVTGAWGSSGEWRRDAEIFHEGGDSLRPVAPAAPPYLSYESEHFVQAPVTGPGYFSFMTWVGESAEASYSSAIGWRSAVHPGDFRHHADAEKGWVKKTLWFPPGEHWMRWFVSGTAHDLSLVAIDGISFESSEEMAFLDVVGAPGVVWLNDPAKPWVGVRKEEGSEPVVTSGVLEGDETSRISATVQGPGEIRFRWRDGANGGMDGELWIDGVKQPQELPWNEDGEEVSVAITPEREVEIEWVFEARYDGNRAELEGVVWTPWVESPLGEALDGPAGVTWTTSPEHPFSGRPHPGAEGGTAAYVSLEEGEEAWLEAKVDGPGFFDFWLLDAPGGYVWAMYPFGWIVDWELTIDGRKVDLRELQWPAILVQGEGEHRIRLKVKGAFAGMVDKVSWVPLETVASEGWSADEEGSFAEYGAGGKDGDPLVLLNTKAGESRWIEKTVTGPGLLEWHDKPGYGELWRSYRSQEVVINGRAVLPENWEDDWRKMRLSIPSGTHTVRWSVDRSEEEVPEDDAAVLPNHFWQISGLRFTPGIPAFAEALDLPEAHWLVVGEEPGEMLAGGEAWDGTDAWSMGEQSAIHFCNASGDIVVLEGQARYDDESGWQSKVAVASPWKVILWDTTVSYGFSTETRSVALDGVTAERIPGVELGEALDTTETVDAEGWEGIASGDDSSDGSDVAWSRWAEEESSHRLGVTIEGSRTIRFRWRKNGEATLKLSLNGGLLPVDPPGEDWGMVEIKVGEESNRIEWVHERPLDMEKEAAGEAWIDMLESESIAGLVPDGAVSAGRPPGLANSVAGPTGSLWKPVVIGNEGIAVRCVTGASTMAATVEGPVEISFSGRCFGPELPVSQGSRAKSVEIIIGGGGGYTPTLVGRELVFAVDGVAKSVIPLNADGSWSDVTLLIPAGRHQLTWGLKDRLRSNLTVIGGAPNEYHAGSILPGLQGWVRSIRLKSARDMYDEWAEGLPFPEGLAGPSADADHDGISNLLEYAGGSDPLDAGEKPMEVAGSLRRNEPYMEAMGNGFYFGRTGTFYQFGVPFVSDKVRGVIESSSDLNLWVEHPALIPTEGPTFSWSEAYGPVVGQTHLTPTHQVLSWFVKDDEPTRYFRMKVTLPE